MVGLHASSESQSNYVTHGEIIVPLFDLGHCGVHTKYLDKPAACFRACFCKPTGIKIQSVSHYFTHATAQPYDNRTV